MACGCLGLGLIPRRCRPASLAPHACRLLPWLQQYEKNVRKGMLNDTTIGLWDNAALQVGRGCGLVRQVARMAQAEAAARLAPGVDPAPTCPNDHSVPLPAPTCQEVRIPAGPRLLILAHIDQVGCRLYGWRVAHGLGPRTRFQAGNQC